MTIFDQIIAGELPASTVWEDEHCIVFMDINPIAAGHALVVPRRSVQHIHDLDEVTRGHLLNIGSKIGDALRRSGIRCDDVNLVINDGRAANQTVPHVHLHVIPRYRGDGRVVLVNLFKHAARMLLPRVSAATRKRLDDQAEQIRAAIQ